MPHQARESQGWFSIPKQVQHSNVITGTLTHEELQEAVRLLKAAVSSILASRCRLIGPKLVDIPPSVSIKMLKEGFQLL